MINFDPNYLRTGKTEWAKKMIYTQMYVFSLLWIEDNHQSWQQGFAQPIKSLLAHYHTARDMKSTKQVSLLLD